MLLYVIISSAVSLIVLMYILGRDVCERMRWFGLQPDSKFGSAVTGVMAPLTFAFICSLLPVLNLFWVAILGYSLYQDVLFKYRVK